MKNKKSVFAIVMISLFVAALHFLIGSNYQGAFKCFITGYLIDFLLPMNLYLLLQVALRKNTSIFLARIIGATLPFLFGVVVEVLQFNNISFLGSTYDPLDILMYGSGIGLGLVIDFLLISRLEK
ncbi:MAG: hypothetical protein OEW67_15235 [Cyclobacteriaceae bacterium]|nr:hypothetical protein [Cyclobacteriaceae bacterium]